MSRLVVLSRNSALPFALSTAGHDIVVVEIEGDVRWAEYVSFAEVVLLDVDDPAACRVLVEGIAESALVTQREIRVLLLAGANAAWRDVPRSTAGVDVLALPLTMPRLNEALEALLDGPALPTRHGAETVIDVRDRVTAGPASLGPTAPGSRYALVTQRTQEPAAPRAPVAVAAPRGVEPPVPRTISLVRSLAGSLDELHTIGETAAIIVSEALSLASSDAAAVMARDGSAWRVAHGVGLRTREERLTLSPEHWLISQTSSDRGVILTGGEGQWPQLFGVPLSWHVNLMALPLPPAGALLVLARDGEEYLPTDLELLLDFADEAGHLMADAIDVRRLARLLDPYTDPMD